MDDAQAAQVAERVCKLREEDAALGFQKGAAAVEERLQLGAAAELEDEEEASGVLVRRMQLDDVRVAEAGEQVGLSADLRRWLCNLDRDLGALAAHQVAEMNHAECTTPWQWQRRG